jgi:flagellar basal-body rod protein FlgC
MSFWDTIRIGASGLQAQQLRLDLISNNIANAQTTRTAAGGPYRRQDVVFTTGQVNLQLPALPFPGSISQVSLKLPALPAQAGASTASGVQVAGIVEDSTPGQQVYDPGNPDADAQGYVTYPNVDLVTEMTDMLSATRSYQANLAAIDAARTLALKALDIAR